MNAQHAHALQTDHASPSRPGTSVGNVDAELAYLGDFAARPIHYAMSPPPGEAWEQAVYEQRLVHIHNARLLDRPARLDTEGFALFPDPVGDLDFSDRDAVAHAYYPSIAALVKKAVSADRIYVFDHLVRRRETDRRALSFGRAADARMAASNGRIHNDYTENSGHRRMEQVMKDAGDTLGSGRFAILNAWRSIAGPVLDTPLAVCDARTVRAQDLICAEVRYPQRTGEIYVARHAPEHRWYYYSEMARDEVMVFKQYDSQCRGVPRFTLHGAFDHPHCPPDAPLRQSIEVRCLVVFDRA